MIHCTPTTAALLIRVHRIPPHFVVPHDYGESWVHGSDNKSSITFYDANHCPGAAIVLIQLTDGTCHLHCGDMRYHDKMKEYPKLADVVQQRRLDLVYLDTTYGHPKHDFMPQDEAIETIAATVKEELARPELTLILLSCYSIGKEKVLWECASRTNQLIHVTEKKKSMLECILQEGKSDVSTQILHQCTLDPTKSDIHVIPMGLAGEIWPYFKPNYWKCAEYAQNLEKKYDRIVAFLPTGWADGSNWNKKNSVTSKQVDYKTRDGSVQVDIRLVSYSEHSAFSELQSFVKYLKPRKVIPTVFRDHNDRRKIENHFRNMVDTTRAKKNFFKTMPQSAPDSTRTECESDLAMPMAAATSCKFSPAKKKRKTISSENLNLLVNMGFDADKAQSALAAHPNNMDAAVSELLIP